MSFAHSATGPKAWPLGPLAACAHDSGSQLKGGLRATPPSCHPCHLWWLGKRNSAVRPRQAEKKVGATRTRVDRCGQQPQQGLSNVAVESRLC
jgi:hypothetical protein